MGKDKMIRLAPTFTDTIAQAEISLAELAREADLSQSTIHALRNPSQHPHRKGGMQAKTAWKLANAFARRAQITPQEAYRKLIIEEER
ncbi:MAG: hypothetical protein HGA45_18975 [Chloroflexales bacterium]|nr:hypothetical protein [Chloroflexales bacterium]